MGLSIMGTRWETHGWGPCMDVDGVYNDSGRPLALFEYTEWHEEKEPRTLEFQFEMLRWLADDRIPVFLVYYHARATANEYIVRGWNDLAFEILGVSEDEMDVTVNGEGFRAILYKIAKEYHGAQ